MSTFISESDRSRAIPYAIEPFFSTAERFASRFLKLQTRSVRPLWLCSDQNVRRNDGVSRPFLYCFCAIKCKLWIQWKSRGFCSVYVVFLSDLVMFKNCLWCDSFCNLYLVKSVNLSLTHALFRFVYRDVDPSVVKVNRPELIASFLTPDQINLVRVISSRIGLD